MGLCISLWSSNPTLHGRREAGEAPEASRRPAVTQAPWRESAPCGQPRNQGNGPDRHSLKSRPSNCSIGNSLFQSESKMPWGKPDANVQLVLTSRWAPAMGLRPSGSQKRRSGPTGPAQPPDSRPPGQEGRQAQNRQDLHMRGPPRGSPLPATRSHEGGSGHSTTPVPQPPGEPQNEAEAGQKGGWSSRLRSAGPGPWPGRGPSLAPTGQANSVPKDGSTRKLRTRPHLE